MRYRVRWFTFQPPLQFYKYTWQILLEETWFSEREDALAFQESKNKAYKELHITNKRAELDDMSGVDAKY